jgi:hypothetical protein
VAAACHHSQTRRWTEPRRTTKLSITSATARFENAFRLNRYAKISQPSFADCKGDGQTRQMSDT